MLYTLPYPALVIDPDVADAGKIWPHIDEDQPKAVKGELSRDTPVLATGV